MEEATSILDPHNCPDWPKATHTSLSSTAVKISPLLTPCIDDNVPEDTISNFSNF